MTESEIPKVKPRPIVRLGLYLISRSLLVSAVCCIAGIVAILLLPVLAKNTYISENALLPGSANTMLSSREVAEANRLADDLAALKSKPSKTSLGSSRLIGQYMSNLGAEVNYHKFQPHLNDFHSLHFFSSIDYGPSPKCFSCSSHGTNIVGMIRAPRGDGKEAIVLVTPYNSVKIDQSDALSLSIGYSVFTLLSQVTWLAKDIIWLVSDSQFGEYAPVAAWLRGYHSPVFGDFADMNTKMSCKRNIPYESDVNIITGTTVHDAFRRGGTMAAALVIKVVDGNRLETDSLSIYAEASNGQMPNLDLINIVNYLAVHRQGMHVKVGKMQSLHDSKWLKIVGGILELLGNVARSLNPQWKYGVPVADYVEGTATLASSLYYQALGVPTGPHGAFRDYQVDSITLEISSGGYLNNKARQTEFLLRSGRLIEGTVQSINNLLEKFHQSFFLYLLTSPGKFVSVGDYMIAFAFLIAPLPIVAASLYIDASKSGFKLKTTEISLMGWKWLPAVKQVCVVHLWGAVVLLLPYFICQMPNSTPATSVIAWTFLSILNLHILYLILGSSTRQQEWAVLKSVTLSATFIGLVLMSVVNFSTAEIGALILVPMCLMVQPLKLAVRARTLKGFTMAACNMVLGFIAFPPTSFLTVKAALEGYSGTNIGDFWNWMESLWRWNSATYLYIGMVHLPSWVLCLHILMHPCRHR